MTRTTIVLRWAAVVPAALVGCVLFPLLWHLGASLDRDFDVWGGAWAVGIGALISGWAFVACGAYAAPSHRPPVGYALLGVYMLLVVAAAVLYAVWHEWGRLAIAGVSAVGAVVGSRQAAADFRNGLFREP